MRGALLALLALSVIMVWSGCAGVQEKETAEPAEAKATEEATDSEAAPAAKEEEKKEGIVVEEVAVLTKESSFFGDGALDTYTVYLYDEDNVDLLKEELYDSDGELQEFVIHEYVEGLVARKVTFAADGQLRSYHTYAHTAEGLLAEDTFFDEADKPQTILAYEYDQDGSLIKWSVLNGVGILFGYTAYDYEGGLNTRSTFFAPSDDVETYTVIEYDADSNKIQESLYFAGDKLKSYVEYEYAAQVLVSESYMTAAKKLERKVEYSNDENGNILEIRFLSRSGEITEVIGREYVFR